MKAGKEEDEGGLAPTEDDDAASVYFSRQQAYCPLFTEGIFFQQDMPLDLPPHRKADVSILWMSWRISLMFIGVYAPLALTVIRRKTGTSDEVPIRS